MLWIVWLVLVFVLGTVVGSFLNVCICRLPLEKSILWPGSRCGHCLQPIRWYDNLPLLGYVLLRGRCRHCGAAFSSRYFFIELFTGLAFVGLFYLEVIANIHHFELFRQKQVEIEFGVIPWQGFVVFGYHATLLSFLIVTSFTDIDHMEIPLPVTLTGMVVGLVGSVLVPWPWPDNQANVALLAKIPPGQSWALLPVEHRPGPGLYPWPIWGEPLVPAWLPPGSWQLGLATGVAGLLAGMLILRVTAFLFKMGRGFEGLGVGDADLMMMVGCFLGWQPVVVAFFLAVVPALVFGIGQLILRGDKPMPFGPSLALGSVAALLGWRWLGQRFWLFFFDGPLVLAVAVIGAVFLFVSFLLLRLFRGSPPADTKDPSGPGAPGSP